MFFLSSVIISTSDFLSRNYFHINFHSTLSSKIYPFKYFNSLSQFDYVYFTYLDYKLQFNHDDLIFDKFPDITLMMPRHLMKIILIGMSIMCVENIIYILITKNIHIVEKLSNIDLLNSETLPTEDMLIARDNGRNILNYCDLKRLYVVVSTFP